VRPGRVLTPRPVRPPQIIPAVATTTAAVCGLAVLEMLKITQNKPLDQFRDSSSSLGINAYYFSEPVPPVKAKDAYDPIEMSEVRCVPPGFTKWDKTRLCFPGYSGMSVQDVIDTFKQVTGGLELTTIYHANANVEGAKGASTFLYEKDAWQPAKKSVYEKALGEGLVSRALELYGEDAVVASRRFLMLETGQVDEDGNTCKVPTVMVEW
jgi:hypothetical protein